MRNIIQTCPIPMTIWRCKSLLLALVLMITTASVFALPPLNEEGNVESLTCVANMNMALDEDGCVTILPEWLLAGSYANYDNFTVDIMGDNLTDQVCCDQLGKTIMVTVSDLTSGNSCWVNVFIEDKMPPVLDCADLSLTCTEKLDDNDYSNFLTYTDNCSHVREIDIYYTDDVDDPMCDPGHVATIERTWYATDYYGNKSSCTMTIIYERLDIADVVFPNDTLLLCPDVDLSEEANGVPTFDGKPIDHFCELITFADTSRRTSRCHYEIRRTWTVMDWCDSALSRSELQIITVMDTLAPSIACIDNDTIRISTDPADCVGSFNIPNKEVRTACTQSSLVTLDVYSNGVLTNGVGSIIILPQGNTNELMYVATNQCNGKKDTCIIIVDVQDRIQPTLACTNLVIPLGSNDELTVSASRFRGFNITDNCGIADTLISIMNNACYPEDLIPGDSITFCCQHAGVNPMVIFTVFDESGNSNSCMFEVDVQDKTPPEIECQDITVYLTNDATTPIDAMSAVASVSDNCGIDTIYTNPGFVSCNNVDTGLNVDVIVVDLDGNRDSCVSHITVIDTFPLMLTCKDVTIYLDDTGTTFIGLNDVLDGSTGNCVNIASSLITPNTFDCDDACEDRSVVLTVTDNMGNTATCQSTVTILDTIKPDIATIPLIDIYLDSMGNGELVQEMLNPYFSDNCDSLRIGISRSNFDCSDVTGSNISLGLTISDKCGNNSSKFINVFIQDTISPIITFCPSDTTIDCNITTYDLEDLSPFGVFTATDACILLPHDDDFSTIPIGDDCTKKIRRDFSAIDMGGNAVGCFQEITITDPVAPIIISGPRDTTVNLEAGNCDTLIVLVDWVVSDCSSFTITNTVNIDSSNATSVYIEGEHEVIFTVEDCFGNITMDTIMVNVTDTGNNCPIPAAGGQTIEGRITNIDKQGFADISILLDNTNENTVTDTDGNFIIEFDSEENHQIELSYADDWENGVDVLDVRMIHQSLIGNRLLSKLQLLAADIQNDKSLDYQDLTLIQHRILGTTEIDKTWSFVKTSDLEENEIKDINTNFWRSDELHDGFNHFIGIKLGDVNNDASLEKDGDELESMDYALENREITKGELFEFTISTLQEGIEAIQYSLKLSDNMELLDLVIEEGVGTKTVANKKDEEIRFLSYAYDNYSFAPQIVLKLKSKINTRLSEIVELIDSEYAIAYTNDGTAYNLNLRFNDIESINDVENSEDQEFTVGNFNPNPFNDYTEVSFDVKNENEEVIIEIYAASGEKINSSTEIFTKGKHRKRIEKKSFPKMGVYYIAIHTETTQKMSKVVLIR